MVKTHISLFISNLEKSIEFYNAFFQENPAKVKNNYIKYDLEEANLVISFIENKSKVNNEVGHFGFRVDSQNDLMIKMLEAKKRNLIIDEEMGTSCCYAKQDKFWVSDPDGYKWEIYYFHGDVETNDEKYKISEKKEGACC